MRAIAVKAFKQAPELIELPQPVPGKGELLVKISSTSLNPFDWKVIDGILDGKMPHVFPLVPGADAVGVIAQLGEGVTRFNVGERIFGQFLHAPIGAGTYAEYVTVPETNALAVLPASIDDVTGAALPTAGSTALQLVEALGAQAGQTVLIVGATGGVGSFATQFAKARGLRVLATASADEAARMRQLGASAVFEQRGAALLEPVWQSHPEGIDGLIDLVSDAAGFLALAALVRRDGSALSTTWSANEASLKQRGVRGGNFEVVPGRSTLEAIVTAVVAGELRAPVDVVLPLEDAPAAIERSRNGRSRGKTVFRVASGA